MAKRGASNDLNHDNWDRDDEPEESGSFEKAPVDVIKKRTIKVAKRRNPISTQNEEGKPNIFGGFTGFSKSAPSSNNTSNTFGFLSNLTPKKNDDNEKQTNGTPSNEQKSSDEYYAKLKGLNESVSAWIRQHVTENPLINLQPVFKDYDRYFAELEKLKNSTVSPPTTTIPQFNFSTTSNSSTTAATTVPKFSFAPSVPSKFTFGAPPVTTPSAATFSFGSKPSSTLDTTGTASFSTSSGNTTNLSSLSSTSSSDLTTKPLNFGSTPFTNPVASQTTTTTTNDKTTDNNEESDEPPKVEFTPVVEKDHIYSVRCKLFVKKDGNFGDRGVGTLYLKTIPNNEKLQLIVRADTNLGNLLCNFILSESIPMKRMGKKDVMLVCLPTPEHQPPPVPILLRVKSPEEADELLKTLEKHKK